MGKRHDKLGIKQTIQRRWMDRVVQLMLAGMSEAEIRNELDEFLKTQKQSGGTGQRGEKTYIPTIIPELVVSPSSGQTTVAWRADLIRGTFN